MNRSLKLDFKLELKRELSRLPVAVVVPVAVAVITSRLCADTFTALDRPPLEISAEKEWFAPRARPESSVTGCNVNVPSARTPTCLGSDCAPTHGALAGAAPTSHE